MLKKIESIRGVGLFAASAASPPFARVTLVYGENGRGKSTLAAILRSCASNDGNTLRGRATLGQAVSQQVDLTFEGADGQDRVHRLDDGTWSSCYSNLIVFDADFVSRNVYAGHEVLPEQRAQLLEFALGNEAVEARQQIEALDGPIAAINLDLRAAEAIVATRRGSLSVAAYRELPHVPERTARIDALQLRIQAAQNQQALANRPMGKMLEMPRVNVGPWFEILLQDMSALSADAEAKVHAHLLTQKAPGFERWLSQGLAYVQDETCPFCATKVPDDTLIRAYQAHFDTGYKQLVTQVAALRGDIEATLPDAVSERLLHDLDITRRELAAWNDTVAIEDVALDAAELCSLIGETRATLVELAERKLQSPLASTGVEKRAHVDGALVHLAQLIEQANASIRHSQAQIAVYRRELEGENVEALRQEIGRLAAGGYRHSDEGVRELTLLVDLQTEKARLTDAKEVARRELDQHMAQVFDRYGNAINELLVKFGAQISVRAMTVGYRGARAIPRTEYRLEVRGVPVALTGAEGSHFGNTLSEGDKRALAFAFFIARLQDHPRLSEQVVVVDDPMCSLDRPRRSATLKALYRLAYQARQLILIAHDLPFLQAFAGAVAAGYRAPKTAFCKIDMTAGNLSTFAELDLDAELRSEYVGYLSALERYLDDPTFAHREPAARSIRLAVEGSLKRSFPLDLSSSKPLGGLIEVIRKAPDGHHLDALKPRVPDLHDINEYAKQFMHEEGDPPPDFQAIDGTELATFCRRALAVVYR